MRFRSLHSLLKLPRLPDPSQLVSSSLADAGAMVQRMMDGVGFDLPGRPAAKARADWPLASDAPAAAIGHFITSQFSDVAGTRPYKLYIPASYHGQSVPLIVMLHGCTQSPDDFAAGTQMNEAAEGVGCLVAYPAQTSQANMQRCWNWYETGDQKRDRGEPAIIAGITREIMQTYAVDPKRVYVAGLSAGGAQAAIMANVYPDLYAAAGIHSGLACGAAHDMQSAMTAMRVGGKPGKASAKPGIPTIVLHGDSDGTVNPRNGDDIIQQVAPGLRTRVETGQVPGGRAYTRTLSIDADGREVAEYWLVKGGNHGWFGGSAAGSYTDPKGPPATREMLRFFLDHPKR